MAVYTLRKSNKEVAALLSKQLDELRAAKPAFIRACKGDDYPNEYFRWEKYTETLIKTLFVEGDLVTKEVQAYHSLIPIVSGDIGDEDFQAEFLRGLETFEANLESLIERLPLMPSTTPQTSNSPRSAPMDPNSPIKIFISHSSKDEAFAEAIVALLEGSLQFREKELRCTSVNGYKLKPGDNSADTLLTEIHSCDVLIALLTPDALASGFVLMELGAAWGLKKPVCPILAPSLNWTSLPGPFASIHGVKADDGDGLVSAVEMVREATHFEPRPLQKSHARLTNTLATIAKLFP